MAATRWSAATAAVLLALASSPSGANDELPLTAQDWARIETIRAQTAPSLTVEDIIGLTTFGASSAPDFDDRFNIARSPDGRHIAVVAQRGNVTQNTREFSLLILRTSELAKRPRPQILAQFATTSNRSGVSRLQWLGDSETIAFIGEQPNELPQVYTANIRTLELLKRTNATTALIAFSINSSGDTVAYVAENPKPDPAAYESMRARGFVVTPEIPLFNLIAGDWLIPHSDQPMSVHVARAGSEREFPLPRAISDGRLKGCGGGVREEVLGRTLVVAPDGNSILVRCRFVGQTPSLWKDYTAEKYVASSFTGISETWLIVDLRTGEARPLSNSPAISTSQPEWSRDSRSIRLNDELLSLEGVDEATRLARRANTFDAEVDVKTGTIRTLAQDAPRQKVLPSPLQIRQGMNEPWTLTMGDREPLTVFDPNPTLLTQRRIAHVTLFRWATQSGSEYQGTLYWPIDYRSGQRYPLVFQTRGVDTTRFAPNGLSTTGHAAQPLAGAGVLVLQGMQCVQHCINPLDSPQTEYVRYQQQIEGAIDALDRLGLIDRARIGLQGWSMSCMHVLQMLTRSSYPIAAASGSDCRTDDYFVHLVQAPLWRANTDWFVRMKADGEPFGPALRQWVERAPGFNLDKVKTPLQLVALGPIWFQGVLSEWEYYAGLWLQNKPVEMVYLPDAEHTIVKPWERVTSQQGAVDWFRFWLQGYERTTPIVSVKETAADLQVQYERWRQLRVQRDRVVSQ